MSKQDIYLIDQIKVRNKLSLQAFCDKHGGVLYSYLFSLLEKESLTADVYENTIVDIWEKASRYDQKTVTPLQWTFDLGFENALDKKRDDNAGFSFKTSAAPKFPNDDQAKKDFPPKPVSPALWHKIEGRLVTVPRFDTMTAVKMPTGTIPSSFLNKDKPVTLPFITPAPAPVPTPIAAKTTPPPLPPKIPATTAPAAPAILPPVIAGASSRDISTVSKPIESAPTSGPSLTPAAPSVKVSLPSADTMAKPLDTKAGAATPLLTANVPPKIATAPAPGGNTSALPPKDATKVSFGLPPVISPTSGGIKLPATSLPPVQTFTSAIPTKVDTAKDDKKAPVVIPAKDEKKGPEDKPAKPVDAASNKSVTATPPKKDDAPASPVFKHENQKLDDILKNKEAAKHPKKTATGPQPVNWWAVKSFVAWGFTVIFAVGFYWIYSKYNGQLSEMKRLRTDQLESQTKVRGFEEQLQAAKTLTSSAMDTEKNFQGRLQQSQQNIDKLETEIAALKDELKSKDARIEFIEGNLGRVIFLAATSSQASAFARCIWDDKSSSGVIYARNLPKLKDGQVWQVWATVNGDDVSLGFMNPNLEGSGSTAIKLEGTQSKPEEFFVTDEPLGGSEAPTGETVISGS